MRTIRAELHPPVTIDSFVRGTAIRVERLPTREEKLMMHEDGAPWTTVMNQYVGVTGVVDGQRRGRFGVRVRMGGRAWTMPYTVLSILDGEEKEENIFVLDDYDEDGHEYDEPEYYDAEEDDGDEDDNPF